MAKADREKTLEEIGARVRHRRRELELTQEKLAEVTKLSKSFISEVESGSTAANGLIYLEIARALDVPVQWLLQGAEAESAAEPGPPSVSPMLSAIAEEQGWSHRETLDVAAALQGVIGRRTRGGQRWVPDREHILAIAKALRTAK
jgi:DNA-binding XRE family transcriptional regulator